ncbi:hypothetical protein DWX43_25625 [Clostridium sp. AF19-22AC]|uniref:Uncharacterized protein n=1 Tax=Faecalicatena orotica TaxID=1544 RepID=A0A2Y9BPN2_9FIRM|nr:MULTISPECIES: hypothetical protein [Clostridia]PWJ20620.1 hypothetical protein A8806_1225 [Faecalicatena orotica]RHR20821.1 hypothetical protein DWX43_25625 [Clostridium sp. AF19-22AC]SSA58559.1 hypothetical protein SAMN05216536_1225 [Faecalicatena orotica]
MLTNLILGIIVTAGALYGLYLMKGIDRFIDDEKELQKKAKKKQYAVIFGKSKEMEQVASWFEKAGIEPVFLESVYIDRAWQHVEYLAAVSDSDIDNLSACNLFRKMYPGAQIFSLCNEKMNMRLYRQSHVQIFTEKEELLQRLELLIMENEVGAA